MALVLLAGTLRPVAIGPFDLEGHQSSLRARLSMNDGTYHAIMLQGVGCAQGMCSRVRLRDTSNGVVWLDRLASVHRISQNAEGPVNALFTFKDGSSREMSITSLNRVLYVGNRLWTRHIDLRGVEQIDFD